MTELKFEWDTSVTPPKRRCTKCGQTMFSLTYPLSTIFEKWTCKDCNRLYILDMINMTWTIKRWK